MTGSSTRRDLPDAVSFALFTPLMEGPAIDAAPFLCTGCIVSAIRQAAH